MTASTTGWRPNLFLSLMLSADAAFVMIDWAWTHLRGKTPNLFDLNGEANIPTWWASTQLLLSGSIIGLIALRSRSRDRRVFSLAALSGLLILMSMDETACFHERLGAFADSFLDSTRNVLPKTGYWPLVVGLPAAALIVWTALAGASFLQEAKHSLARFLFSLAVLFSGAIGVELLNNVSSDALRHVMIDLEEALEMAGGSLLVWSALDLARRHPITADGWKRLFSPD